MAADAIVVNRGKPHGNSTVEIANTLATLRAKIDGEYGAASHMFADADYTVMESEFGLQPGTGQSFLVLLRQLTQIMTGTGDVSGADRLARLDEFSARLGGQ